MRALDDAFTGDHGVLDRRAGVAPVELLAHREREVHLVEARLAEPLVTAFVEREPGVDDALASLDRGDHLLGVGHLRHARRVDEAHGLDARHAGGGEPVDELGAGRRAENLGVVLEAVARSDVADGDRRHTTPSSRKAASSSSASPSSSP